MRGHDSVNDDEHVRRQIGLSTAEERSFYWRLTGEQNLMFFARLHGLSDRTAKQRIQALFARLESRKSRDVVLVSFQREISSDWQ